MKTTTIKINKMKIMLVGLCLATMETMMNHGIRQAAKLNTICNILFSVFRTKKFAA